MVKRMKNWGIAAVLSLGMVPSAFAQQEGDTVVCVRQGSELKTGHTVVDTIGYGFALTVRGTKDGWYWVDNGKPGWINAADVIMLDQAPAYFTQRVEENPGDSYYLGTRGLIYRALNKLDLALADYDAAISLNPNDPGLYGNRANVHAAKGDHPAAIQDQTVSIRLRLEENNLPGAALAYVNRARSYVGIKDPDRGLEDCTEALRLDATFLAARHLRADIFAGRHDYASAIAELNAIREIDQRSASANNSLAWIRAACPDASFRDGIEAARLANNACALTNWKDPNYIDTLAAAFAECRDFRNAQQYQRRAIALLTHKDATADFETRLALYVAERPYRYPGKFAGYNVGDEAVVLGTDVTLKHPTAKLPALPRGTRFHIAQVENDLVAVKIDGELGWLHQREIIPADQAIEKLTELIAQDRSPQNYLIRATARQKAGQWRAAMTDLDDCLVVDPLNVTAINNRAWMLATCPQADVREPKQALTDARRVNDLTQGKVPACLGTLAAALAANEEYEAAVKVQAEVIRLLQDENELKQAEKALGMYRAGLPYRDSIAAR